MSETFRKVVTGEKADVGGAKVSGIDSLGKNEINTDGMSENGVRTEGTNKSLTRLSDQDEYALRITDDQIQSERAKGETTYARYLEGLRDNARVEDGKRIERDAILKQYPIEKLQELAKNGDYDTLSFVNAKLKALDKRTDFEADNSFYKNLSIENSKRNAALKNGNNVKVSMPEYAMARVGGNGIEGELGGGDRAGSYGFNNVTDSANKGNRTGFSGSGNGNESLGANGGLHNDLNNPATDTPSTTTANGMENPVSTESQGITSDSTISENSVNAETIDGKNRGEYNEVDKKINPLDDPKIAIDVITDANAVYGYRPKKGSSLDQFDIDWSSTDEVSKAKADRLEYLEAMKAKKLKLSAEIDKYLAEGKDISEIAEMKVNQRNSDRINTYINKGEYEKLENLYARNLIEYGQKEGPTVKQLLDKYGSYEDVIYSSVKVNKGMNLILGIEN